MEFNMHGFYLVTPMARQLQELTILTLNIMQKLYTEQLGIEYGIIGVCAWLNNLRTIFLITTKQFV